MTYVQAVFAANSGKVVSRDTWGPGEWLLMRDGLLRKRGIDGHDVQYAPTSEDEAATDWGPGVASLRREA